MQMIRSIAYVSLFFVLFMLMISADTVEQFLSRYFSTFETHVLIIVEYVTLAGIFCMYALDAHRKKEQWNTIAACIMVCALIITRHALTFF